MADDQLKRLHVKVPEAWLLKLDAWRRRQPDLPTRSEAIRRAVSAVASPPRARRRGSADAQRASEI
jgi:hypothetical protein